MRWEPPPEESRNGIVTGYIIQYNAHKDVGGRNITTDGNHRIYTLTDLATETLYQVKIAAFNVNGTGPYTNKLEATTFRHGFDGQYYTSRLWSLTFCSSV